ncbi:MAG: response regulator [Chloroflexi bacterium]|nr:response regulator [Chloroflexota bacterium]
MTNMIASIHHPLLVVDPQLRISIANDDFLEMFPGIAEGGSLAEHFNPEGLTSLVADVAESGRSKIDLEMTIGGTAGEGTSSERLFRISVLRLTGPEESPLVLITIDEMTELRLRETQLLESSRLVAVGEMTASVAHELNNPLTAIIGFSQLAMLSEMDETLARDVEAIATEARRAGRIVDNLLSFARRRQNDQKAFSPTSAVQHVLDLRRYECKVNNIEVVTYFDDDTPWTVGDLHQLQQVFLNILNNAIHAISDHRGHGVITIGVVGVGENIRVSFADDGPGIPSDVMARIFEPFYTTKPVGKGTGLGLSICRKIVESHNGTLAVKSREGRGATFTIEIPVLVLEENSNDIGLIVETADPVLAMLKVLVVDDEPSLIDLVSRALSGSGHDVETAPDGAQSLQLLYTGDYDAILLDMKMPGLGGQEVYQCLQSIRPDLSDRVMFMSGDASSPDVKTFIETTGNPLLKKPFSLDDLRKSMNTFANAKLERMAVKSGN